MQLAREMGVSGRKLEDVRIGALLHDLSYINIPDSILYKPGSYSEEEWDIMKKHPQYAVDMLSPLTHLRTAVDIPHYYHENWDGTGYPRGLKDVDIPIEARIFSVVDVYDSLTHNTAYRMAWSKEEALKYIQEQSGKKFDPKVVEIFIKLMRG